MRQEGKIHKKLVISVRMMAAIALILGTIVLYEVLFMGVTAWLAALLAVAGLLIGWYVFLPLNRSEWNEEKEVVAARRMDALGFAAIAAYIVIVVGLRFYLNATFHAGTTMLILSLVCGMLIGRVAGTISHIHRAFKAAH